MPRRPARPPRQTKSLPAARRAPAPPALPAEVLHAALRAAAPLRRRKGVLGLSIGMRNRGGRWVPGEHGIAVRVADKADHERDLHPRQILPRHITVELGRRTWQVPVDVHHVGATAGTCYGHVARPVTDGGRCIGGVSACVVTTGAPKFLISGHVAATAQGPLSVDGLPISTEQPVLTARLDHCLARATFQLGDASLPNLQRFTGIRKSSTIQLGEQLFVYRALDGAPHQVTVLHTKADTPFEYSIGVVQLQELIGTNDVCGEGDSGSPLYDDHFRLVGTLVGGHGEDFYLPADYAFQKLSISLPI